MDAPTFVFIAASTLERCTSIPHLPCEIRELIVSFTLPRVLHKCARCHAATLLQSHACTLVQERAYTVIDDIGFICLPCVSNALIEKQRAS